MPCSTEIAALIADRVLECNGRIQYYSLPTVNGVVHCPRTASMAFHCPLVLRWRFWIEDPKTGHILYDKCTNATTIVDIGPSGYFSKGEWSGQVLIRNAYWCEIRDVKFVPWELFLPVFANPDSFYWEIKDFDYYIARAKREKEKEIQFFLVQQREDRIDKFKQELMTY